MEIVVINPFVSTEPHFAEIGVITAYKSVIWDVHLYGLGYFELVVAPTAENRNWLKEGRFLCREEDIDRTFTSYRHAMVIRTVDLEWNPDEGYMMHVTGRMLKDVLNQRIIWFQISKTNYPLNSLIGFDIMKQNVVDPRGYAQGIVDDITAEMADAQDVLDDAIVATQQAYQNYQDAVTDWGPDDPRTIELKEIYEADVAAEQAALDEVNRLGRLQAKAIYDKTYQDERAIPYTSAGIIDMPIEPPRVDVQLHGEQIGDYCANVCEENSFGWRVVLTSNLFFLDFVVGTDKSNTVIFSPEFDNLRNSVYTFSTDGYFNGAQVGGEGEGLEQVHVYLGTQTGINRFETYVDGSSISQNLESAEDDPDAVIDLQTYRKMLKQYGKTELQQYSRKRHFTGEIEPYGMFKLGVDYDLGDTVKLQDGSINSKVRLIELVYSDEEAGTNVIATFEEVD